MKQKIFLIILFIISINLCCYSQTSYQAYLTDLKCTGGMPTSIYVDKKTDTFYAGCWGGIWKYNGSPGDWTEVDSDPDHCILANAKIMVMFIDSKGVFYAGCDDRTQSYISYDGGKKWEQINDYNFTSQRIYCITEGIDGSVYIGTGTGIIKTSDNGVTWKKLKGISVSINCLYVNSTGKIFAGVGNGILCTTISDSTWTQVSLPGLYRAVFEMESNSKGRIYAGANGDMYASDNDGSTWYSLKPSFVNTGYPNNPVVSSITVLNNDIVFIVANFGGGAYRSIDNVQSWERVTNSPPELINPNWQTIRCDSKNNLYGLATRYGAMKIEENTTDFFDREEIIASYYLHQNYPNPFNPVTTISYQLPAASHVQLKIYDPLGREVATLVDEYKQAGTYNCEWRTLPAGRQVANGELTSGIYFYRLSTSGFVQCKKMVYLK